MLRHLFAAAAFAAFAVAACSGAALTLSDYDTACQEDVDCVGVYIGDCSSCMCPNAAIAKTDLPKYEGDARALDCGSAQNCDCALVDVACQHGVCQVAH